MLRAINEKGMLMTRHYPERNLWSTPAPQYNHQMYEADRQIGNWTFFLSLGCFSGGAICLSLCVLGSTSLASAVLSSQLMLGLTGVGLFATGLASAAVGIVASEEAERGAMYAYETRRSDSFFRAGR